MTKPLIWVLTFSVLGSTPEYKELPKYNTKQECLEALQQYRQEYKENNKKVAGSCHQSTKQ